MIVETRSAGIVAAAKPRDSWGAWRTTPTDSLSGQGVTPSSALALAAVHGAVSLIADANGIMPLEVIDTRQAAGSRVVRGGWLAAMLQHEPNEDMSGVDLWTFVNACMLLRGNAYLAKLPQADGTVQLYPMLPDIVTPYRSKSGKVFRVRLQDGAGTIVDEDYTSDAILHVKGRSLTDPLVGSSPIQLSRQFLGTQLAQQEYQAKSYADGLLIKGVLSTPASNITPDAADMIKSQWRQATGGIGSAHDVAVLHSGVTFQHIGLSPEDAQLIETMRWGHTQVATAYKIPASRLNGEGASLTYSNQGQDDLFLDKQACLPIRAQIEASLNRDRLLFGAQSAWVPRFNPEIVLRADPMTRADVYQKMRAMGAISVNEIRRFEDWSDIGPEGDDYTPVGGMGGVQGGAANG